MLAAMMNLCRGLTMKQSRMMMNAMDYDFMEYGIEDMDRQDSRLTADVHKEFT